MDKCSYCGSKRKPCDCWIKLKDGDKHGERGEQ